ncbi:MAG TPA: acyltransferase [Edaphobacter sp.]|nr:acyltransferase [Edaphobacter sp.]
MPHIPALDGIRGVAILLVLFAHLLHSNNAPTSSGLINLILRLRNTGWVGVDLFFALSGFLITGILYDSLSSPHYFRNFYVRRILRIFPLYYGVLLVLSLIFRPHWSNGRQFYLLLFYLQNTPLWWHGPQSAAIRDATAHLWSLAVEEQFYLVWPFVVFWVRERRRLLWLAIGVALMAPAFRVLLLAHGATFRATYMLTICRCDSLLAGAWLALAIRGPRKEAVLRAAIPAFWGALLLCLGIGVASGNFNWEENRLVNSVGYTLLAICGTSLIAMVLRGGVTAGFMKTPVLRWFGKYSYGIYILHVLVGWTYMRYLHSHIHSKIILHAAIPAANLLITLPLAWMSFRWYEQPFLRLKRYFGPA